MIGAQELADRLDLKRFPRSWRGDCPACAYARTFSVRVGKDQRISLFCASCRDRDGIQEAVARIAGADWKASPKAPDEEATVARQRKREAALRLWRGSEPIAGTTAARYLEARGIADLVTSAALRFRADCHHPEGGTLPGMVALIVDATGSAAALHRTYLRPDGRAKAAVEPPRASLGPAWGGAVRLHEPLLGQALVIGEGIETAASAGLLLNLPAWAAIAAGNLAAGLQLPSKCNTSSSPSTRIPPASALPVRPLSAGEAKAAECNWPDPTGPETSTTRFCARPVRMGESVTIEDAFGTAPLFSDDGLALAFSERHAGQLLYVPAWSQWLRWDGTRWAPDDTLRVFDLARALCRDFAAQAKDDEPGRGGAKVAHGIAAARTIASVERLARADARHARRADDFDADPWVINTPAGVVDLRTGLIRPHAKGDYFTKVAGTAPGGTCPRWESFLREITLGDEAMVAYLHRFIGYSITGIITEHAFGFLYGPGGNGKSVLLSTIAAMLGDYATTAMPDVFTLGRSEQHPTHLASLRGARMVAVTETEEGRPWAEARIKSLTGGDRISARVMRGDPFEFTPVFKLWIAGNHRPSLRNPDPAMRRRLHLMPLTFVPQQPDPKLPDALRDELPGILAWAVRGCLEWQRIGLQPPPAVTEATDSYFAEQDSIATWFAARVERRIGFEQSSRALFNDWVQWAKAAGEDSGSEKRFSESMEKLAAKKRKTSGTVFLGVKLGPSDAGVL